MDRFEYKVGMKVIALRDNWGMRKGYITEITAIDSNYGTRTIQMPFKVTVSGECDLWVEPKNWKILDQDCICYECIHDCKDSRIKQCAFYEGEK